MDVNWKHFDVDGEIKVYSEKVDGPTEEKLTDIIAVPINHWITKYTSQGFYPGFFSHSKKLKINILIQKQTVNI